jgi:hypothetical protein
LRDKRIATGGIPQQLFAGKKEIELMTYVPLTNDDYYSITRSGLANKANFSLLVIKKHSEEYGVPDFTKPAETRCGKRTMPRSGYW